MQITCAFFFMIFAQLGFSLELVQIDKVSTSKKSMIINRGFIEGVKVGERAFFLKTVDFKTIRKEFIGLAQAMKVFDKYSVWYFTKMQSPQFLEERAIIDIVRDIDSKAGRRQFVIRKKEIIRSQKDRNKKAEIRNTGREEKLIKKVDEYELGAVIADIDDKELLVDFEILELGEWIDNGNKFVRPFNENASEAIAEIFDPASKPEDVIKSKEKQEQIEVAINLLNKTERPDFSIEAFYAQQEKMNNLPEFKKEVSIQTSLDQYDHKKAVQEKKRKDALKKIKEKGIDWSDEFNDEQLVRYVNELGLRKELKRQDEAFMQEISHEFNFNLTTNVTDSSTTDLQSNEVSSNPIRFGFGYEYLWLRNSYDLLNWTTELSLHTGNNNYDLFGAVSTSEAYGRINVFYYLFNPPTQINSLLFPIGVGVKSGFMSTSINSTDFEYGLLSTTFSAGLKYRIGTKFGARFLVNFENANLTLSDGPTDTLVKQEASTGYVNVDLSLSYYF